VTAKMYYDADTDPSALDARMPILSPLAVAPALISSPVLVELHPASASASKLAITTLCCFRFMINSLGCVLQWVCA